MKYNRDLAIEKLSDTQKVLDVIVIGGGATGLGAAVDAASRGYSTVLIEQNDFSKGTSSKSTKLLHGGIRYLAQGNISLVKEACYERGLLIKNAPHLASDSDFIIPCYNYLDILKYTIGLKAYDILSRDMSLGKSVYISKKDVIEYLPNIKTEGLKGGVLYKDGQFDDSRLAINLAQTCVDQGGVVLNYCRVVELSKTDNKISGVVAEDQENGNKIVLRGKNIINATGIFVDDILQMDQKSNHNIIKPSQGSHIVLDKSFMDGNKSLVIPKTDDNRVLFAIPWHDKLIVGTTDIPVKEPSLEAVPLDKEIEFILSTSGRYLSKPPQRKDILSCFAGQRPLIIPENDKSNTKDISRCHKIFVSESDLITITGGKWTTYRKMAQDVIDKVIEIGKLENRSSLTKNMPVHGYIEDVNPDDHLDIYGSDKTEILSLIKENPELGEKLHQNFNHTKAQVVWAVRNEMARTVEDVLSRRTRMLFLDANTAVQIAPEVAKIMALEMNKDSQWEIEQIESFKNMAKGFLEPVN
ncbi:glycerol-3-phosphate dehydrogenase/oxidase [Ichthyobacterium seriolicida]|uniref:Glycerol-3-phosphate dehydrogenase n=1 Tax=Ichthyobacterium seriolicida TaxID=242600 RepID=A0A1J1DZ10_9FLAO|nr:glycerol-3-phosphate dehydrogenase/oxidase [Ichthyobacterium seriolicida]BAV95162.1 glycerol-3-phosphate dehydrogenase [Ichthyobacterium seriolicida]